MSDKKIEDTKINIKSLQANSLYRVNNGCKDVFLDYGKAEINNSLFSEYMCKHGVTVNKKRNSNDFILMKFDYGVKPEKVDGELLTGLTAKSLRKYYYENGVKISRKVKGKEEPQTTSYKMLMRSAGKAKEGDCIFIKDNLYKKALYYITMGLWEKMPNDNAKIVELSAYSTLITATAIDYIQLPLDSIFVVEDEQVSTIKSAVSVKSKNVTHYKRNKIDYDKIEKNINGLGFTFYKKKRKRNPHFKYIKKSKKSLEHNGIKIEKYPVKETSYTRSECYVERNNGLSEVTNVLWDGMGLIDDTVFPKDMDGFIYCRSHFFKSCLFRGNIQQYFKDYYEEDYESAEITDMFGRKMKVSDIKVIITENSLKWMKFIDLMGGTLSKAFRYYEKFMKKQGEKFAIVKTAHSSKWGEFQRSSYQINGTLPSTDENILRNVTKESVGYCNRLKIYDKEFLKYLRITGSAKYSINNVLIALYEYNQYFKYTQYFKDKRTDIISRFKKERLQLGKLIQYGDNLTICGNPIALLMKVTGQDFINEPCFKQIEDGIQCYTSKFNDGEKLAAFRSPHNAPNNIVHLENVYSDYIKKYFSDLGDNVIIINGIRTDVQQRLNGQDLDSDSVYVTNQKDIVDLAKKAYLEYPTIVNAIQAENSDYKKDMESYAEMDNDISSSQYAIGRASNIAQLALSYYFHDGSNNQELEDVFIICSVLAQVAIDSAKRNFNINVNKELTRIANLECMKHNPKYPRFYAKIQKLKQRKSKKKRIIIDEKDIGDFNCPMDIIYRIIDEDVIDLRKYKSLNTSTVNFKKIFDYKLERVKNRDRKQHKKIISIVNEYDEAIKKYDIEDEDYHENIMREFEMCRSKLDGLTIKNDTMYSLIAYAFHSGGSICDKLLTVLYDKDHEAFLSCFEKSTKSPRKSKKDTDLQGISISTYEEGHERNVS